MREIAKQEVTTLAFVVMPDHVHWLVQLGEGDDLASTINKMKSRSALKINRRLGRTGRVWQRGYFDRGIRSGEDLVAVARYIVANPLRAGIVADIGKYPHWDAVWVR